MELERWPGCLSDAPEECDFFRPPPPAADDSDAGPEPEPEPEPASASRTAGNTALTARNGFEPGAGTYVTLPQVKLSSLRPHGRLYFTLDGSSPNTSSTPYASPIELHGTTLIRVAEVAEDGSLQLRSASYVQISSELASADSNLPLLVVHTLAEAEPDTYAEEHTPAVAHLQAQAEGGRIPLLGQQRFARRIGIKVRGRSTRHFPKHSFSFEVRDEYDEDDEHAQLLDLPPQSDWVLYAPYRLDRALLRNSLFYQLSRNLGRYAPRTRFVELYLASDNQTVDASSYRGVFVLTEAIKRDHARVPLQKLAPEHDALPALSGGYLVRIDEPDPPDLRWSVTGIPQSVILRYPKADRATQVQLDYIEEYLSGIGRALQSPDGVDPQTQQNAYDMLDVDSFIDHHILTVFVKNPDGLRLSSYMHKNRNGKLMAGPVWDCDRCMGSYDGRDKNPEGWLPSGPEAKLFDYGWWQHMFADPGFESRYWARFAEHLDERHGPLRKEAVFAEIRELASGLREAAARNAARYPEAAPRDGSFELEVDLLAGWLQRRIEWTRANLGQREPTLPTQPDAIP